MKHPEFYIQLAIIIMLLVCLFDMPYAWFALVRIVVAVDFLYLLSRTNIVGIKWIFGCSALIIQPIVKFHFGRTMWNVLDVIWAVMIIGYCVFYRKGIISSPKL